MILQKSTGKMAGLPDSVDRPQSHILRVIKKDGGPGSRSLKNRTSFSLVFYSFRGAGRSRDFRPSRKMVGVKI